MANMYGQSGALKDLLGIINTPELGDLEDIIHFTKTYSSVRQKKIDQSVARVGRQILAFKAQLKGLVIEKEALSTAKADELQQTISRLESELSSPSSNTNFIFACYARIKRWFKSRKLASLRYNFQAIVEKAVKRHKKSIASIEQKISHTQSNIRSIAEKNIAEDLRGFDRLYNTIEMEKSLLYGAIGEVKVMEILARLPGEYHVFNDLRIEFSPPVYNRSEKDRIHSVQVDHLVVGPTGVFVVETKNWSSKTIENDKFFSPVKQVKRAGFALFVLLNNGPSTNFISRFIHKWGERKISPRQIVAFVKTVPQTQFQFVKLLGLDRLLSYITYGKKDFSDMEVRGIVDFVHRIKS